MKVSSIVDESYKGRHGLKISFHAEAAGLDSYWWVIDWDEDSTKAYKQVYATLLLLYYIPDIHCVI